MKNEQLLFREGLQAYSPVAWEQLPDLGLYMDQIITYLERQLTPILGDQERLFTPAMVNNYVKMKLVDRPIAKKYGREQLAQLLMISLLKQAATAEEIKQLFQLHAGEPVSQIYASFCAAQGEIAREMAVPPPLSSSLHCAIRASTCRLLLSAAIREAGSFQDTPQAEK